MAIFEVRISSSLIAAVVTAVASLTTQAQTTDNTLKVRGNATVFHLNGNSVHALFTMQNGPYVTQTVVVAGAFMDKLEDGIPPTDPINTGRVFLNATTYDTRDRNRIVSIITGLNPAPPGGFEVPFEGWATVLGTYPATFTSFNASGVPTTTPINVRIALSWNAEVTDTRNRYSVVYNYPHEDSFRAFFSGKNYKCTAMGGVTFQGVNLAANGSFEARLANISSGYVFLGK